MNSLLPVLHWLASFIVLAEALNKLERTAPCAPGLTPHQRLLASLKALAWAFFALGAGGGLATPVLGELGIYSTTSQLILHQAPSIAETAVMVGFAILIIRTRLKEG